MLRPAALWGSLALLLLSCERWLNSCFGAGSCLGAGAGVRDWMSLAVAAGAFLVAGGGAASVLRTAWLLVRSSHEVSRLPLSNPPERLLCDARAVGIRRLRYIDIDTPVAFCAGSLRPSVYASHGLIATLNEKELRAVLVHEMDHARAVEPLWRAIWRAAAEVGFFFPLLHWARCREIERSELRADRRAIEAIGAQPVASALWTLGSEPATFVLAAFAGSIELRASQLLGDPLPRRRPKPHLLLSSLLGIVFALVLGGCVTEIVVRAIG